MRRRQTMENLMATRQGVVKAKEKKGRAGSVGSGQGFLTRRVREEGRACLAALQRSRGFPSSITGTASSAATISSVSSVPCSALAIRRRQHNTLMQRHSTTMGPRYARVQSGLRPYEIARGGPSLSGFVLEVGLADEEHRDASQRHQHQHRLQETLHTNLPSHSLSPLRSDCLSDLDTRGEIREAEKA